MSFGPAVLLLAALATQPGPPPVEPEPEPFPDDEWIEVSAVWPLEFSVLNPQFEVWVRIWGDGSNISAEAILDGGLDVVEVNTEAFSVEQTNLVRVWADAPLPPGTDVDLLLYNFNDQVNLPYSIGAPSTPPRDAPSARFDLDYESDRNNINGVLTATFDAADLDDALLGVTLVVQDGQQERRWTTFLRDELAGITASTTTERSVDHFAPLSPNDTELCARLQWHTVHATSFYTDEVCTPVTLTEEDWANWNEAWDNGPGDTDDGDGDGDDDDANTVCGAAPSSSTWGLLAMVLLGLRRRRR